MRKSCKECPWTDDSEKSRVWKAAINALCKNNKELPYQACHKVQPYCIRDVEHDNACIGHINHLLKKQQSKSKPNERKIQELALLLRGER